MQRNEKPEAYWRAHVQAQRSAGLSVRAYCRREGLAESNFHWWWRELARRMAQAAPVAFAAVEVIEETSEPEGGRDPVARPPGASEQPAPYEPAGAPIEVHLAGNRRVLVTRGFGEAAFVRVVALREGDAPCRACPGRCGFSCAWR